MTIIDDIKSNDYRPDDKQVALLARSVHEGVRANGTFLRVLIARCQDYLKASRRNRLEQGSVIDDAHTLLYAAVLEGLRFDNPEKMELNRRANFARSATSTLRRYVKLGGDIRKIDLQTVTKASLRISVSPQESANQSEKSFQRAHKAVLNAAKKLVQEDAEAAQDMLNALMDELDELVNPPQQEARVVSTKGLQQEVRAN